MATSVIQYDGQLNGARIQPIEGVTSGDTITLNIKNGTRAVLFAFGWNADRSAEYLLYTTASGSEVALTPVKTSNYIEITSATNQITVRNTSASGTLFLYLISFAGGV